MLIPRVEKKSPTFLRLVAVGLVSVAAVASGVASFVGGWVANRAISGTLLGIAFLLFGLLYVSRLHPTRTLAGRTEITCGTVAAGCFLLGVAARTYAAL